MIKNVLIGTLAAIALTAQAKTADVLVLVDDTELTAYGREVLLESAQSEITFYNNWLEEGGIHLNRKIVGFEKLPDSAQNAVHQGTLATDNDPVNISNGFDALFNNEDLATAALGEVPEDAVQSLYDKLNEYKADTIVLVLPPDPERPEHLGQASDYVVSISVNELATNSLTLAHELGHVDGHSGHSSDPLHLMHRNGPADASLVQMSDEEAEKIQAQFERSELERVMDNVLHYDYDDVVLSVTTEPSVSETDGAVDIILTLATPAATPVAVDLVVESETATLDEDFEVESSNHVNNEFLQERTAHLRVNFAAGESEQSVTVNLIDDSDIENNERFSVITAFNVGVTLADDTNIEITSDDIEVITPTPNPTQPTNNGGSGGGSINWLILPGLILLLRARVK